MPIAQRICTAALCAALVLPGCGIISIPSVGGLGEDSALSIRSLGLGDHPPQRLAPRFTLNVYRAVDENTADLYLSDLPRDRLIDPDDNLAGLSGSILHVHIFLIPQAGSTPISASACNVTIRHLVLASTSADAEPASGLFGGAGFMLPSGLPGESGFGGRILDASHRLLRASPSFSDMLGPSVVLGRVYAQRDDRIAEALAARCDALINRLEPQSEPTPTP